MTNTEIIENAKKENNIDCAVNTYGGWIGEGKKVKKGERAVFKVKIWKPFEYETKNGEQKTKIKKVNSAFFGENQVEKIKEEQAVEEQAVEEQAVEEQAVEEQAKQKNPKESEKKTESKTKKPKGISIVKGIVKHGGDKFKDGYRMKFDGEEYIAFTDGHRFVASKDDFGYETADDYHFDELVALWDDGKYKNSNDIIEIVVDKEEVKKAIKENKDNSTDYPYHIHTDFGEILINTKYLDETMRFVGTDRFYITLDKDGWNKKFSFYRAGMFFINPDNERLSVVLPIAATGDNCLRKANQEV